MTPQKPSIMKKYGTIAIIILVFILVYFFTTGDTVTTIKAGSTLGSVGSSELSLLNQIKSLHIDTALFSDPSFTSLQDNTSTTTIEQVGRPNPFAPLPGEVVKPVVPQGQPQGSVGVPAKNK